jgi:hypothetical protein
MRSIGFIGAYPASLPLNADEIVEFHLARLLCLVHVCGVSGKINGLTKFAKLDFFSRYPDFFEVARAFENEKKGVPRNENNGDYHIVESTMVRHHYGPWDKRYYHALAHMESKGLVLIVKSGRSYQIELTGLGKERAKILTQLESFEKLVQHMKLVKTTLGSKTGAALKKMIYDIFETEVSKRPMGEKITA